MCITAKGRLGRFSKGSLRQNLQSKYWAKHGLCVGTGWGEGCRVNGPMQCLCLGTVFAWIYDEYLCSHSSIELAESLDERRKVSECQKIDCMVSVSVSFRRGNKSM